MEDPPYREVYYTKVVLDDPSEHEAAEMLYVTTVVFDQPLELEYRLGRTTFSIDFYPQFATVVTEYMNEIKFPTERAAVERVKNLKLCAPQLTKASNAKKHHILCEEIITNKFPSLSSELEKKFLNTMEIFVNEMEAKYNSERAAVETDEDVAGTWEDCWNEIGKKFETTILSSANEMHTFLCSEEAAKNRVTKSKLSRKNKMKSRISTGGSLIDLMPKGSVERKFTLGKTSFSKEFIPKFATVVTDVMDNNEFPTEHAAAVRVADLKICCSAYVARASNAMKHRILLEEEARDTMQSWINQMATKFIKSGGSWFDLIRKDHVKCLREFVLGLKHIHEKGYIFEGRMVDVIKTPTVVKIFKVKKPKDAGEFEVAKRFDLKKIIEFFYDCLYKPANVSNSWAISHPDSAEVKQLGLRAEVLHFVSQLEKIKDMEKLPHYSIFENPIFLDIKQRRAYMSKLVASLATSNR